MADGGECQAKPDLLSSNVGGNTAANGIWTVTPVDPDGAGELTIADGFELDGSTSNNPYTSGGTWVTNFVGISIDGGVGQQIRGITFQGSAGTTAIDANALLRYCDIDVTVRSGAIGIDLKEDDGTSRIFDHNTIKITTATDSPPSTKIDLPTGWQKATPKNTTNIVIIDGERYYPPSDEF